MIVTENYLGKIVFSTDYIKSVVSKTVSECFGVAGMSCTSLKEYIFSKFPVFGKGFPGTGIKVKIVENEVKISLHISVAYGTNISAVVKSVKNKVRFALAETAGIPVRSVSVYVDNVKN